MYSKIPCEALSAFVPNIEEDGGISAAAALGKVPENGQVRWVHRFVRVKTVPSES